MLQKLKFMCGTTLYATVEFEHSELFCKNSSQEYHNNVFFHFTTVIVKIFYIAMMLSYWASGSEPT